MTKPLTITLDAISMDFSLSKLKPNEENVETLHVLFLTHELDRAFVRRDIALSLSALARSRIYGKIESNVLAPLEVLKDTHGVLLADEVAPGAASGLNIRNVDITGFVNPSVSKDFASFEKRAKTFRDNIIEIGNLQLYSEYTPYTEKNPLFIYCHNLPLGEYPVLSHGLRKLAIWLSKRELTVLILNHIHNFGELDNPSDYQSYVASMTEHEDKLGKSMYPSFGNIVYLADTLEDCMEINSIGVPTKQIFQVTPVTDHNWQSRKPLYEKQKKDRENVDGKLSEVKDIKKQIYVHLKKIFPSIDVKKKLFFTNPDWGHWKVGELFLLGLFLADSDIEVLIPWLDKAIVSRFKRYLSAVGSGANLAETWTYLRVDRKVSTSLQVRFLEEDIFEIADGWLLPGVDGPDLVLAAIARQLPFLCTGDLGLDRLEQEKISLPGRYEDVRIKTKDVDMESLSEKYREKFNQERNIQGLNPISDGIFKKLFDKHKIDEKTIRFNDLDEENQIKILVDLAKNKKNRTAFLKENPSLKKALASLSKLKEAALKKNADIVEKKFSLSTRAQELQKLFGSVTKFIEGDIVESPETSISNKHLVEKGLSLGNIRLI